MKYILFFRNVGFTEPVCVNPAYVDYVEPVTEDKTLIHLTGGIAITVYESFSAVLRKLEDG